MNSSKTTCTSRQGTGLVSTPTKKAASSIFMLHNESMNIWSHLLGALGFLSLVFYVLIYLQPTSLHEATPLQSRWMQNFDNGRFDLLQCDKADFNFPTKGSEGE
mmetsp:Transcript_27327/g.36566  ORF Transcript_27327/g.36566 Transcript_27327/m.36566 type:complete len:104 (+) Transcript_27327:297-608(+)